MGGDDGICFTPGRIMAKHVTPSTMYENTNDPNELLNKKPFGPDRERRRIRRFFSRRPRLALTRGSGYRAATR